MTPDRFRVLETLQSYHHQAVVSIAKKILPLSIPAWQQLLGLHNSDLPGGL
jgi:hypothetical protein